VGERSGKRFQLGDRMTVQVARVDLETTKIDFVLSDKQAEKIQSDIDELPDVVADYLQAEKREAREKAKAEAQTDGKTLRLKSGAKPKTSAGPSSSRANRRGKPGRRRTSATPKDSTRQKGKAERAKKKSTKKPRAR